MNSLAHFVIKVARVFSASDIDGFIAEQKDPGHGWRWRAPNITELPGPVKREIWTGLKEIKEGAL